MNRLVLQSAEQKAVPQGARPEPVKGIPDRLIELGQIEGKGMKRIVLAYHQRGERDGKDKGHCKGHPIHPLHLLGRVESAASCIWGHGEPASCTHGVHPERSEGTTRTWPRVSESPGST